MTGRNRRTVRANIISWDSGGLGTDIDILGQALLRAGCDVWYKGHRYRKPHNRLHSLILTAGVMIQQSWIKLTGRPRFDINFFIESVFPEYLSMARVNTLLVNPEWFRDEIYEYLPRIDFLLCKTSDGIEAVRKLPLASRNIGFSSPDKRIEGFIRSDGPIRCLHLSGQSALKGSESVVEAWSHHQEWPHLTVVRRAKRYGGEEAPPLPSLPNVQYETDHLTDEELRQLQNECEVHVIPSLAEGYGHIIGEAMSCGAVVVTTDAPPMNELIGPNRGMLIRVERTEKKYRSTLNYIDVADLEVKLNTVFAMSHEQRSELGRNARAWYDAQHVRFENELQELINEQFRSDDRSKR
jgi:glycosyltransferase involved in cell wall biosynthesis